MRFAATYLYATLLAASIAVTIAQPVYVWPHRRFPSLTHPTTHRPPLIEERDSFDAETDALQISSRDMDEAPVEARFLVSVSPYSPPPHNPPSHSSACTDYQPREYSGLFTGAVKAIAGAVARAKAKKAAKRAEAIKNGTLKEKPKKQPKQKKPKGGKHKRDLLDVESEEFERSELEELIARYLALEEEEFEARDVLDEEFEEMAVREYEASLDDLE